MSVIFGILAPRPPQSANKEDVKSTGLLVRQAPKDTQNLYLDFEYPIALKQPLDIDISIWKVRCIKKRYDH